MTQATASTPQRSPTATNPVGATAQTPPAGGIPAQAPGAHSLGSERLVLSAALRPERAHLLPQLMGTLSGSDFYMEAHGQMWDAIRTLVDTGSTVDPTRLLDYAAAHQVFIGGPAYLSDLLDDPLCLHAVDKTIQDASARVKDFSITRMLESTLSRAKQLCAAGSDQAQSIIARIEDDLINLKGLAESTRRGPKHIGTVLDHLLEHIEKVQDGTAPMASPTTYDAVDAMLDGFYDEDLIIIAARPSMGKTSALLGLAKRRAEPQQRKALIFSLESRDTGLVARVLAADSKVSSADIRNARLDGEAMDRISESLSRVGNLPIWVDDSPGLSIHEIRARARAHIAKHGKCDIYVDYLQIIAETPQGGRGGGDRNMQVADISRGLKQLARELGVPVIALAQLSRNLESRANKRPMMSDLRESGQIEQDADVIIFLYRDEVYNPDTKDPGVAEWIVAKQRDGAIGTARLGWAGAHTEFFNLTY